MAQCFEQVDIVIVHNTGEKTHNLLVDKLSRTASCTLRLQPLRLNAPIELSDWIVQAVSCRIAMHVKGLAYNLSTPGPRLFTGKLIVLRQNP